MINSLSDGSFALACGLISPLHQNKPDDEIFIPVAITTVQTIVGISLVSGLHYFGCCREATSLQKWVKWTVLAGGASCSFQLIHTLSIATCRETQQSDETRWSVPVSGISGLTIRTLLVGLISLSMWKVASRTLPWDHRVHTLSLVTWLAPAALAISLRGLLEYRESF